MADGNTKQATLGAVAAVMDGAAPAAAEQLDFLAAPSKFGSASRRGRLLEVATRRDRAGRPPGAQNLATREMLEFIRRTIGDPMQESARWLLHTPQTLAQELGCTELEAFDRLEKIRADLRPYFYARKAAVDDAGNAVVPGLTVVFGPQTALAAVGAGASAPWLAPGLTDEKTIEHQALSKPAEPGSHGGSGDDAG